jgi:hypothetical protein
VAIWAAVRAARPPRPAPPPPPPPPGGGGGGPRPPPRRHAAHVGDGDDDASLGRFAVTGEGVGDEQPMGRLGGEEEAARDGVERGRPGYGVELGGRSRDEGAARGVDERVEAAEPLTGPAHQVGGAGRTGEVGLHDETRAPKLAYALAGLTGALFRQEVRERDVCAVFGEIDRQDATQST